MARRVNTKFVVAMCAVLVVLIGGAVLVALKVQKTFAENMAMAEEAIQEASNLRDQGDIEASNAFFEQAWKLYGSAYQDDPNRPDVLGLMVDTRNRYIVDTAVEANNQIDAIVSLLKTAYEHNAATDEQRLRFIKTLTRYRQENLVKDDQSPLVWTQMINNVTEDDVANNADDRLARRYLALTGVELYRDDMRENQREEIRANLDAALEHAPGDVELLTALAQLQYKEAQRIQRVQGNIPAVTQLYDASAATIEKVFEAQSVGTVTLLDTIAIAASLPDDRIAKDRVAAKCQAMLDRLKQNEQERQSLAAPTLSRLFNVMQVLSNTHEAPELGEDALAVVQAVAKEQSDKPHYRLAYARALAGVNRHADAVEQMDAALAIDKPLNAEQYLQHASSRVELLAMLVESRSTLAELASDPAEKQAHLDAAEQALAGFRDVEGGSSNVRTAQADYYAGRLDTIRNRYNFALAHLDQANAVFNDRHAPTLRLLAMNHQRAGNLGAAAAAYEKALQLQNNPMNRLQLIQLYLTQGGSELQKAAPHIQRYIEQRPEDPAGYLAQAQYLAIVGQPDSAIEIIEQMDLESNPQLKTPLARYMAQAGQTDQAIALLRERINGEPADGQAIQLLLTLLPDTEARLAEVDRLASEEKLEAQRAADLRQALTLSQSTDLESQKQLIEQLGEGGPQTALQLVELYRRRGQADQAREQLAQALAQYPENPQVLEQAFGQALEDGDRAQAEQFIDRMLALPEYERPESASDPALLRTMARAAAFARADEGDPATRDQLITEYRRAMASNPNNINGWLQLGQLLGSAGQWAEARDAGQRAFDLQPSNLRAIVFYAQTLGNTGDFARAVELLASASRANPNNNVLLNQYLAFAQRAGYNDLVLQERERIRESQPSDMNNRRALAELYIQAERLDAALTEISAAIEAEGLTLQNAAQMARIRIVNDQPDAARSVLEQYLAERGEESTAQDQLLYALFMLEMNELADAQAAFEQAKAKDDSENDLVSRQFADALTAANYHVEAARLYRTLAGAYPEDNAVKLALAQAQLRANALNEAELAAKSADPSANRAMLLFEIENQRNNADAALAILQQAYRDYPKNDLVTLTYGRVMLGQNKVEQAAPAIRALASRQPASPDVQLLLARLELAQGDRAAAQNRLTDLIQSQPNYLPARETLFMLLRQESLAQSRINPDRARDLANQALAAITPLADLNQDNESANQLAGQAAELAGQAQRAVQYYDRAFAANKSAANLLALSRAMISAGMSADAVALLESPDHAGLLEESVALRETWARALAGAGRTDAAKNLFTNLLKQNTNGADRAELARIVCNTFADGQGVELVDQSLGTERLPQVDLVLSQFQIERKAYEAAIARLDGYEANPPSDAALRGNLLGQLGLALQFDEQYERSKRVYEQALQATPDSLNLLNNLAYLLSDNLPGYEEQALSYAERAMELVEANADQVGDLQRALMLDTLGWAQFRAGKAELAIKTLLKSTQLQPVYANLSHLGRVYAAQGESARAYNTLVAARDEARRSNNPQEIEEAERYLQELNP